VQRQLVSVFRKVNSYELRAKNEVVCCPLFGHLPRHRCSPGETSRLRSSYERGCQEKNLSPPLAGNQGVVVTYIQPCLLFRGAFDVAALDRRVAQRRYQPKFKIPTRSFHVMWRLTPVGYEATQAQRWLMCQPSSYVRLEAYGFVGLSAGA